MNENDLWEILGDLGEEECEQVLIQLFVKYEERLRANPEDDEARRFFNYLGAIITQVRSCNVNRR